MPPIVSTMTVVPCNRVFRMAHGATTAANPTTSITQHAARRASVVGAIHATRGTSTIGKGQTTLRVRAARPSSAPAASGNGGTGPLQQRHRRCHEGGQQKREQRLGQELRVRQHERRVERGDRGRNQASALVVEARANPVHERCSGQAQQVLKRAHDLQASGTRDRPESRDQRRIGRRAQRGRPAGRRESPALDHARGEDVVVLLVHDLETQVRRHHEDDQAQTQGGKEDDAEALARVEGCVGWAGHSGATNQSKSVASGRAPSGRPGTEIVARGPAQPLACRSVQPQWRAQMSSSRRT